MSPLSRVLLFLMIGLAVVIAGLWISGGKKDEYSSKIEINAPPPQIFPFLVEPDRMKAWQTGLEQVDEPVPPKEGYVTPPELVRTVVSPKGKRVRYNDLVIRYTPNEILTIRSSATGTDQISICQLEPIGTGKTQFSYSIKVTYNGVWRLIAPLRSSNLQDRINTDVRKLKELVEKSAPALAREAGNAGSETEAESSDAADLVDVSDPEN